MKKIVSMGEEAAAKLHYSSPAYNSVKEMMKAGY
jgi:hypothetical protein